MNIATFMATNVDLFTDKITGEVNETALAEYACEEFGIVLENGEVPERIYFKALRIAQLHEIKTGARTQRIRSDIGDYMNHIDADFTSRTA